MKKSLFLLILTLFLTSNHLLLAQDTLHVFTPKTIAAEELIGNKRLYFQLMVNKRFGEKKKTGLLSLSAYAADYENHPVNGEFQHTTLLFHHLYKGISVHSGTSYTVVEGLTNFVGFQYMIQRPNFSFLYLPDYYLKNKLANTAIIEYRPALTKKWALYTRIQIHYTQNLNTGTHFRSYAYSRLGLTYTCFSFGLAHNFDRYGTNVLTKNNYGIFLKLTL